MAGCLNIFADKAETSAVSTSRSANRESGDEIECAKAGTYGPFSRFLVSVRRVLKSYECVKSVETAVFA